MTGQTFPDKSTSKENNGKRPRDDDDDEQVAANVNGSSESRIKRRRTSRDDNDERDIPTGDTFPNNRDQAESSSSSSSGLSNDESLSDVEVDIDDLESIHEFDIEDLGEFEAFGDHYDPMTGEYEYSEAEGEDSEIEDEEEEVLEPSFSSMSGSHRFQERQSWMSYLGGKEYFRLAMADEVESDSDDEF